ncbi:hypothetical protein [Coleofasciculus sp. FACHB-T130]|nr:hypothetical protein [Coleofasciculus sp. FACHB-T130]
MWVNPRIHITLLFPKRSLTNINARAIAPRTKSRSDRSFLS